MILTRILINWYLTIIIMNWKLFFSWEYFDGEESNVKIRKIQCEFVLFNFSLKTQAFSIVFSWFTIQYQNFHFSSDFFFNFTNLCFFLSTIYVRTYSFHKIFNETSKMLNFIQNILFYHYCLLILFNYQQF